MASNNASSNTFPDCPISHPLHVTFFQYPCLELIDDATEQLVLYADTASENRYEPRPLIDDDAVAAHSFRDGPDETAIYTVSQAELKRKDISANMSDVAFDNHKLVHDMEFITGCNGTTWLNFVTCYKGHHSKHDNPPVTIRIERKTLFRFAGYQEWHESKYEFLMTDLETMEWRSKPWLETIMCLVRRRTDVANLHVQGMLTEQRSGGVQNKWASPRYPDYQIVLNRMIVTPELSTDEEENDCPICRVSLSAEEGDQAEERDEVVQLPCEGKRKHQYHLKCLLEVCKNAGPKKSRCPLCRRDIITDNKDIFYLKYGVVDLDYVKNYEYLPWENFERSCADLDKHLAENSSAKTTVNQTLVKEVFETMTRGALLEMPFSTPHHLQPVRCADFPLLKQAVLKTARSMNGMSVNIVVLDKAMKTEMLNAFAGAFKDGHGLFGLLDAELRAWWSDEPLTAKKHAMRPGFFAFAARLVSRMLQFLQLRRCGCTDGDGVLLHWHGDRGYYNPDAEVNVSSRATY